MRKPTKEEVIEGTKNHVHETTLFYQTNVGGVDALLSNITKDPKVVFRATRYDAGNKSKDIKTFDQYGLALDFILGA
jgi:hypothetical protein